MDRFKRCMLRDFGYLQKAAATIDSAFAAVGVIVVTYSQVLVHRVSSSIPLF
jgi:hypothetical protein